MNNDSRMNLNLENRINDLGRGLSHWYDFHLVESASLSRSNLRSLQGG